MRNYKIFPLKTMRENLTELFMEIKGGNINGKKTSDLWGDTFEVKPYKLFMEINGGDINWGFLNELIKNHEGDIVRGDTFHAYHLPQFLHELENYICMRISFHNIWNDKALNGYFN